MQYNNKDKVDDDFLRGVEKYRDDKDLLDFLEAYFMFSMQDPNLRNLNKEDFNFTTQKLYGIMELRDLLIKDKEVEEPTKEPVKEGSVHSLLSKVQKLIK